MQLLVITNDGTTALHALAHCLAVHWGVLHAQERFMRSTSSGSQPLVKYLLCTIQAQAVR